MVYKNNFITVAYLLGVGGGGLDPLENWNLFCKRHRTPPPEKQNYPWIFFWICACKVSLIISVRLEIKYIKRLQQSFIPCLQELYTCITLEIKKWKRKKNHKGIKCERMNTDNSLWGLVCYNLRKKIKPRFLIRQILWTPLCTGCCVKTKRKWAELTGWRLRNRWALDAGYVFCWDLYHDMRRLHAHIRSISRNGFILCKFFAVIFVNNSLELTPSAVFFSRCAGNV